MSTFEDIVIVDLDVGRTAWSRVHSSMRTLYLKLNRDPEPAWSRLFFEERNSRVELKRHGLWIEDGYIVFDCLLIDVDDYHLPDIRQSIDYANARSRVLTEARYVEAERLRGEARTEQHMLTALRSSIRGQPTLAEAPTDEPSASLAAEAETEVAAAAEIDAPPPEDFAPPPEEFAPPPEEFAPPAEPTVSDERAAVLEARRNDWRARFRAAFERNKK